MSATQNTQTINDPYDDDDNYYEVTLPNDSRRARQVTTGLIGLIIVGISFYGGVWMQKHHGSTSTSGARNTTAAGFGNRTGTGTGTGANRTGSGAGTSRTGTAAGATRAATGGAAAGGASGATGGGFGGFGGGTNGTVTSVSGSDIYVTEASGNVIKISTSGSSTVTKTETGTVSDIKPGETVTVRGTTGDDGSVAATSINVGNSGAAAGGAPAG